MLIDFPLGGGRGGAGFRGRFRSGRFRLFGIGVPGLLLCGGVRCAGLILLDRFNGHTVAQGDFFLADPEAVPFQRFPRCVCFISRGAENARLFQGTVTGLCALPGKSLRRAGGERGEECVALFIAHAA